MKPFPHICFSCSCVCVALGQKIRAHTHGPSNKVVQDCRCTEHQSSEIILQCLLEGWPHLAYGPQRSPRSIMPWLSLVGPNWWDSYCSQRKTPVREKEGESGSLALFTCLTCETSCSLGEPWWGHTLGTTTLSSSSFWLGHLAIDSFICCILNVDFR